MSFLFASRAISRPFWGVLKILSCTYHVRDCAIIIRRRGGRGAEKLELSSKNLDSTPPPKQKELVLTPFCYVKNNIAAAAGLITLTLTLFSSDITKVESNNRLL